ncbi:hypothetical protein DRQ18_02030 [bacterium]|nr:MAG: hypothetical protein DRQ18_02030 [bacterium]
MRIIKKYSNRRMYDTTTSKPITLRGIAELISRGEEVKVVDHETGEDITPLTLAQIIMEQERGAIGAGSAKLLLSELIKKGRERVKEFVEKSMLLAVDAIALTGERVRELIDEHVKKGRITREEGERIFETITKRIEESRKVLREEIRSVIKEVIEEMEIPSREEVREIKEKIDSLNRKLSLLLDALKKMGEE